MSSRRWFSGPLLAGVASVVVLAVSGCGGDGGAGKDEVASADRGKAATRAAEDNAGEMAKYVEGQRKYVECLRGEGFDVPDPDANGQVEMGDAGEWKRDPKSRRALEKCSEFSLPVPDSLEEEMQPELTEEEIEKNRRYSTCMQENGAPDFPDIGEDGHFEEVSWDPTSAGGKRAQRKCAPILGLPENPGPAQG